MLRRLDAAGFAFRTGSHGENRTARCDRASGFSLRGATAGRISSRLAGSQTHVGAGIGACGIQDGGETVGSGFRLRSLAKNGSAAEHARCFQKSKRSTVGVMVALDKIRISLFWFDCKQLAKMGIQ